MEYRFLDFIKHITRLPDEQESQFTSLLSTRSVDKGNDFIRAGQYPKTIGFVRKGLFRYYYTSEDGTEFTKGFFEENTVLSSYSAMLENRTGRN